MATKTPPDPAATLETAAKNTRDYGTVDVDNLDQEYTSWPVWVLDPTEEVDSIDADGVANEMHVEPTDYLVHITALRDNGRANLDTLRENYLDQLFADIEGDTNEEGHYELVRRSRLVRSVGSDEVLIDSLVIRCTQRVHYN